MCSAPARPSFPLLCLLAAACLLLAASHAFADDDPASDRPRWGIELKRQNTDRGTVDESTRTTVRLETYLDGPVTLLRLDLPFPDAKTDFAGSPFEPRLGDIKFRAVLRDLYWGSVPWSPRGELTAPTANPESLGSGKWQLMLGARTSGKLAQFAAGAQRLTYGFLAQQTAAIAGDPATKGINYTKFELELRDAWAGGHSLEFTLKPAIDWVLHGQVGAVGELEYGRNFAHGWHLTFMGGGRLWGPAVASTYNKRLELSVGRRF